MKSLTTGMLLFLSVTVFGQQYIVFSIKGAVWADGQPVQIKSVITDETSLVFKSQDGALYVLSPQKGKLIISAGKAVKNENNEFLTAVKNAILPPTQYRTTSTRSNINLRDTSAQFELEDIFDLKAFFLDRVLVIDTSVYRIGSEDFVQDGMYHFVIKYKYGEDDDYTKELPGMGQQVYLSAQDIFAEDECYTGEDRQVKLYYAGPTTDRNRYISTFTLVRGDAASIAAELKVLYELEEKKPTAFLFEEALPFLEMRYGKTNPWQVKQLLEEHLGLRF